MRRIPFVLPDRAIVENATGGSHSYAIRNYYGRGPIAYAKRRRFRRALKLASRISARRVIDMGTGDGVLLPTLSQSFEQVLGIDLSRHHVEQARSLARSLQLENVEVVCLEDLSFTRLREETGTKFQLMLLLETLEHVGSQRDIWTSKMDFLRDCFSLLEGDGRIIVTVPKMVGPVMLFKNVLQRCLGRGFDAMTFRQLLRSSFLRNTDELEKLWTGGHVGFNHLKLDAHLGRHFLIQHRSESLISVFYVLSQKREDLS